MVRECLAAGDQSRISAILKLLIEDFANSVVPNARNGGLIALAAVAIALGSAQVAPFLPQIAPPILSCFSDQDSRVRYYACESMYNVAKVARASILTYFNPIFDALSRLYTDPEVSVKNGAELLDRLIKDIVSEKSLFSDKSSSRIKTAKTEADPDAQKAESGVLKVPGTVPLPGYNLSFFSLERFIPLLVERIRVTAPATRLFLVNWIAVLDSVPDLELVAFLPEFLSGLFSYLSDPNQDIRTATLNVLGEFLKEIRDVVELQREKRGRQNETEQEFTSPLGMELSEKKSGSRVSLDSVLASPPLPPKDFTAEAAGPSKSTVYSQGQGIQLDFGKMTHILQPHLSSPGIVFFD
jgi:vacuole morphology and inheritance protein 14